MFLQNPHILIVENVKKFRDGLRAILEPLTPHIYEAMDGMEGLKMAKNQHFDIIFLNLLLPRIDGVGLIEVLTEMGYKAKMVIVSGTITNQERVLGMKESGAFDALGTMK
jgi:CheY-like chemotaxis protein